MTPRGSEIADGLRKFIDSRRIVLRIMVYGFVILQSRSTLCVLAAIFEMSEGSIEDSDRQESEAVVTLFEFR